MMSNRCLALLGIASALNFSAISATAQEASCGKWTTAFGSLAGEGEALNTSFCSEASGQEFSFEITCNAGSLNVRFMPITGDDGQSFDKVTLDYAIDGKSFLVETQFEELDGAFAADIDAKDSLIEAMKAGQQGIVTLKGVKSPAFQVPLAGFKRAMTKLVRNCK